jgi:nucleoside-diphosphate-sugar epimerase
MRVLLIGGNGFIGPSVVNELVRAGHDIAILHRGRADGSAGGTVTHILGDRRRLTECARQLLAFGPEVVIDLILSSGRQARELVALFRGHARRVVGISSCDVYRACGVFHRSEDGPLEPLPLTETSALRTKLQTYPPERIRMLQEVFGWLDDEYDKIPVELALLDDRELQGTIVRLPMVYGPGDRLHRFLPVLSQIDQRASEIFFEERHAAWRSPRGFVENVGAAIALAASSPQAAGRIYNVAERESWSELEWAREIASAAGWHGRFVVLPADRAPAHLKLPGNFDQHWTVDSTRVREELGYRELVSREAAIRRTIAWERSEALAHVTPSK